MLAGYISLDKSADFLTDPLLLQKIAYSLHGRKTTREGIWYSAIDRIALVESMHYVPSSDEEEVQQKPFIDQLHGIIIIFDGQLYNTRALEAELVHLGYELQALTEAELIAVAYRHWGIYFLEHLEGSFVCALFDRIHQEFFLARDHHAERSVFIHQGAQILSFASSIKTLWLLPWIKRSISYDKLSAYLMYGYMKEPWTWHEHIYRLPAGSFVHIDAQRTVKIKQWQRTNVKSLIPTKKNCLEAMQYAVCKRIVPNTSIASVLSGNTDATILVSLVRQVTTHLSTYTLVIDDGKKQTNEFLRSRRLSRYFETTHYEFSVDEKDAFDYTKIMHQELYEPYADAQMLAHFIGYHAINKAADTTLIFDPQGLDEYDNVAMPFLPYLSSLLWWIPDSIKQLVTYVLQRCIHKYDDRIFLLKWWHENRIPYDFSNRLFNNIGYRLCSKSTIEDFLVSSFIKDTNISNMPVLSELCLVGAYRSAQAAGVRKHAPFLDDRVYSCLQELPTVHGLLKSKHHQLNQIAQSMLPTTLHNNGHKPLMMPLEYWFKEGRLFKDHIRYLMTQNNSMTDFIDRSVVHRMLAMHEQGQVDCSRQLWIVYQLLALQELWDNDASLL